MSEIPDQQLPPLEERLNSPAEIAAYVSSEATALDLRAQASGIVEVDGDENPDADTTSGLQDGLHRIKKFPGHLMFVVRDGKKTHEIRFRDSIAMLSREHPVAPAPEIGLSIFHGGVDVTDDLNQSSWITSSLRVVVNADEVLSASRIYRFNGPKGSKPDSVELSREDTISGAADVLDAVESALEEHERSVTSI
jgi:hypothetical protein